MRVAMFMPGLLPSSLGWAVHTDFARGVESLGHRFQLLTTGSVQQAGAGTGSPAQVLPMRGASVRLGSLMRPLLRTRSVLPAAAALARYLRTSGRTIDLLHVEVTYPHGAAAALAVRLSGWKGPLIITPMGEDTLVLEESSYGFRRHPVPRALIRWTLTQASIVRCISPMLEQYVAKIVPERPRRVVPLNVSSTVATAACETRIERHNRRRAARELVDRECGTAGQKVVLSLGRLHPFKGIDVLVRAMRSVPNAILLVVGPSLSVRPIGDVATRLTELAASLGLANRVRVVGETPPSRALDWLAAADVVAVPSHLESLNKVCVEAAAVGTPFVVTSSTGISSWVTDGIGTVVPPADPEALAAAVNDAVGRRTDEARIADFVKPFTPETVASEMVGIYREVADSAVR